MGKHIEVRNLSQLEFERLFDFAMAGQRMFGNDFYNSMKKTLEELQTLLGYKNYQIMAWNEDDKPF